MFTVFKSKLERVPRPAISPFASRTVTALVLTLAVSVS
jgi:hypothetical protein